MTTPLRLHPYDPAGELRERAARALETVFREESQRFEPGVDLGPDLIDMTLAARKRYWRATKEIQNARQRERYRRNRNGRTSR